MKIGQNDLQSLYFNISELEAGLPHGAELEAPTFARLKITIVRQPVDQFWIAFFLLESPDIWASFGIRFVQFGALHPELLRTTSGKSDFLLKIRLFSGAKK